MNLKRLKLKRRKKMERILSKIPALRILYKASCIDNGFMYASDAEVLEKAKDDYYFFRKEEDPEGIYISNKDENSPIVKLRDLDWIEVCPFHNKALIQKARKTLVEIWFENAKDTYEEALANTKSEKKKKALVTPVIETYMEKVFIMTDYDVFLNLEFNDYFVFEQKESLTGYEGEGQEVLLKVNRNENN